MKNKNFKDTKTFLMERSRLCQSMGNCSFCPLNDIDCSKQPFEAIDIDEVINTVSIWSGSNPHITYKEDFKSKFPNAMNFNSICRRGVYGQSMENCSGSCDECWEVGILNVK